MQPSSVSRSYYFEMQPPPPSLSITSNKRERRHLLSGTEGNAFDLLTARYSHFTLPTEGQTGNYRASQKHKSLPLCHLLSTCRHLTVISFIRILNSNVQETMDNKNTTEKTEILHTTSLPCYIFLVGIH